MKIEVGKTYRNIATRQKVRVESVNSHTVCFTEIGNLDGFRSTSVSNFQLKYELGK
jgi:hypothetical protein